MSVYVDDMRRVARVHGIQSRWSHLQADAHDELEAFAQRLGLQPAWIQYPGHFMEHYDITESGRQQALSLGAVSQSYPRESGRWTHAKLQRLIAAGEWPPADPTVLQGLPGLRVRTS